MAGSCALDWEFQDLDVWINNVTQNLETDFVSCFRLKLNIYVTKILSREICGKIRCQIFFFRLEIRRSKFKQLNPNFAIVRTLLVCEIDMEKQKKVKSHAIKLSNKYLRSLKVSQRNSPFQGVFIQ